MYSNFVGDIYVGDDGKLHKIQGGADSVLPFSNKIIYKTIDITVTTTISSSELGVNKILGVNYANPTYSYQKSTGNNYIWKSISVNNDGESITFIISNEDGYFQHTKVILACMNF